MIMTIMTAALEKPNAWHLEDHRNVRLTNPEFALAWRSTLFRVLSQERNSGDMIYSPISYSYRLAALNSAFYVALYKVSCDRVQGYHSIQL